MNIKQRQFFPGQPEAVPPVYVESMTLQEVRCFGEAQTLKFTKPDGSIAQWTVILGENGVGKTTVLQCLAGMQPVVGGGGKRPYLVPRLSEIEVSQHWHRSITNSVALRIAKDSELKHWPWLLIECVPRFADSADAPDVLSWIYTSAIDLERSVSPRYSVSGKRWLAAFQFYGYGASRRMAIQGRKGFEANVTGGSETLFNNENELNNAEEWLLDLDNLASQTEGSKEKRLTYQRLTNIFEMLPNVLPMVHEVEFQVDEKPTKRVRVKFRTDYGWLPIESLSYGYQTMISWIVDFTRRMYDRYPDAKDPLAQPAIVLVDGIDLHLHPKWQRELMGFLSKRFPKTQFIVTAHSPLIIQSEEVANVILLQRDPNKPDQVIVRQDDVAEIRKWRLDQILTSDLYGLESANAPDIKAKEARRSAILRKAKLTPKDEAELSAIEDVLSKLPAFSSREAVKAEQRFQATAALLEEAEKMVAKPKAPKRNK